MLSTFAAAVCLMLVVEGMMPFLAPAQLETAAGHFGPID